MKALGWPDRLGAVSQWTFAAWSRHPRKCTIALSALALAMLLLHFLLHYGIPIPTWEWLLRDIAFDCQMVTGLWCAYLLVLLRGPSLPTEAQLRDAQLALRIGFALSVIAWIHYGTFEVWAWWTRWTPFSFGSRTSLTDFVLSGLFAPFGSTVALVFAWRRLRWLRRVCAANHCRHCSYNLTGNVSGVCPECGRGVEEEEKKG
jgi:hypothetical protein